MIQYHEAIDERPRAGGQSRTLGRIRAVVTIAAVVSFIAACGSSSDGDSDEVTLSTAMMGKELITLDMAQSDEVTLFVGKEIFDSVIGRVDGEYVPRIASDWETLDDLTWEFTIRDDVTFHDGEQLTADDVKASLERTSGGTMPQASYWTTLDEVEVMDDFHMRITTTQPMPSMLSNLEAVYVAPAEQQYEDGFWDAPVGSGPFMFESWQRGDRLTLVANEDYWDGAPKIDRLEFREIIESSSMVTALLNGEVDAIWPLPMQEIEQLRSTDGIEIVTGDSYRYYMMWFNKSREPFDDERVRQAMWHAVDVQSIQEDLFGDSARVALGPIAQAAIDSAEFEPYEYNPELARELLAEAGYPDGFSTSAQWAAGDGPSIRDMMMAMISDWSEVGISVEPLEKEPAVWDEDFTAADYDINMMLHSGSLGDAASTIGRLYHSNEVRHGYSNPEVDALLEDALATMDPELRSERFAEVQEIIWNDAVGMWPLELTEMYAISTDVQNFESDPFGRPSFRDVEIRTTD